MKINLLTSFRAWSATPTLVSLEGVHVEEGKKITVGFEIDGKAGCWAQIGDIALVPVNE